MRNYSTIMVVASSPSLLETLPSEILTSIFSHITPKQLLANSSAILCTSRVFYEYGTDELRQRRELDILDLIHFQVKQATPRQRLRHIKIGLNGFEQCCHYHTLCGRRLFHCPHTGKFCTTRGFGEFINEKLSLVIPSVLSQAPNLCSFSFQAYCGQLAAPFKQYGDSFVHPSSIIKILNSLSLAGAGSKLTELVLDTDCSEEAHWTPGRGIGDKCESHVCPIIAKTISSLPRLRKLRVRRRDICPQLLQFDTPHAHLESIAINLRLSELQCTGQSVWAAQSRHCQCHCPCEACFKASELLHGPTNTPTASNSSDRHYHDRVVAAEEGREEEAREWSGIQGDLSGDEKFEQWKYWRYLEQKQNQSMFEEMLACLRKAVATSAPNVREASVLGYSRPMSELPNVYREPIIGTIRNAGQEVHVVRDKDAGCYTALWH